MQKSFLLLQNIFFPSDHFQFFAGFVNGTLVSNDCTICNLYPSKIIHTLCWDSRCSCISFSEVLAAGCPLLSPNRLFVLLPTYVWLPLLHHYVSLCIGLQFLRGQSNCLFAVPYIRSWRVCTSCTRTSVSGTRELLHHQTDKCPCAAHFF